MGNTVSLPGWIIATQWASRGVLILLVALSVWSVAIMVDRFRALYSGKSSNGRTQLDEARQLITAQKWDALRAWVQLTAAETTPDPLVRVPAGALKAALDINSGEIDRAVRSHLSIERVKMEKGLTTLATLGSNAPFIGLFGTVLGIIQAFGSLAAESSNTHSVMTGISEALMATAVGLFVAIPAVIAYNVFSRRTKLLLVEAESLRDYFMVHRGG
ncbi:MotA/TolQ/ExbB proton channel family protein [Bdellovibrionota bacterium FG-1]